MKPNEKEILKELIRHRLDGTDWDCWVYTDEKHKLKTYRKYYKEIVSKKRKIDVINFKKLDPLKYPDLYLEVYREELDWLTQRFFPQKP